jgi:hypothetical protein
LYNVSSGSDGDTLSGAGGNNLLVGSGAVTYDVGSGDGVVTVYSTPGGASGSGGLVSLDSSFAPSTVAIATAGPAATYDDITIANGNGDEVDLESARSATAAPITQVDFSDGTVWTYAQLLAMVAAVHVIDSHGTVTSETGNGDGDTFIYNQGYGSLQINVTQVGSFTNVLSLGAGITQSGITVSGDANGDILITDGTSGDQVNLAGMALYPGDGVQLVQFADGSSLTAAQLIALSLQGTTGADTLYGTSGADVFDGLGAPAGTSDYEQGNGGADTFIYNQGYGQLVINEFGSTTDASVLKLGASITEAEVNLSGDSIGDLVVTDGTSGDQITLDNYLAGSSEGAAEPEIMFADGTVLDQAQIALAASTGTTGADVLYGTSGTDVLDGRGAPAGSEDLVYGQGGTDTFIFNAGYGQLEINENNGLGIVANTTAVLQLGTGITLSDLSATADSSGDLFITDGTAGDRVEIDELLDVSFFGNTQYGVAQIQFADGTTIDRQQIVSLLTTGTTAADTLALPASVPSANSAIFDGKGAPAGSQDYEQGVSGKDTFVFNAGYGQLEINENAGFNTNASVLQFGAGITAAELTATSTAQGNLILSDGTAGDSVQIDGVASRVQYYTSEYGVASAHFADGTTLTIQQLRALSTIGTTGADNLYGAAGYGSVGVDIFDGKGAPTGSEDYEQGDGGNDTFIYDQGYGQLEINEMGYTGDDSVLQLGAGITEANIHVTADTAGDVFLTDGIAGDQIELDQINSSQIPQGAAYGPETISFAGGSTLTQAQLIAMIAPAGNTITGSSGADTLMGTSGADVFDGQGAPAGSEDYEQGNGGADTFLYNQGYGQLEINEDESAGQSSTLVLGAGIDTTDIGVFADNSGNIYVVDGTGANQVILDGEQNSATSGVQSIIFADGTTWTRAQLIAQETIGTPGPDQIYGTGPGEVFDGKGGGDYEQGDGGGDTFIYNAGYGQLEINEVDTTATPDNVLLFGAGITAGVLHVSEDGSGNVYINDGTTANQVTLNGELNGAGDGVQFVDFADGTVWTKAQLEAIATTGLDPITGTTAADTLYGTNGADLFDGQGAPAGSEDYEQGNGGADTFLYNAGYGHLEINEDESSGQSSTLVLGAGIDTTDIGVFADNSGNIYVVDGTGANQIILDGEQSSATSGVQSIVFADGTTWTRTQLIAQETIGTPGPDQIYGTGPGEVFDGKGGGDYEQGDGGGDTFIYNATYGQLEINEVDTSAHPDNVLLLGAGITPGILDVSDDSAGNIYINNGTSSSQVTLDGEMNGTQYGVQSVVFSNGTTWSQSQLYAMATTGTTGNNSIYGTPGADVIDGKGGTDYEQGNGGGDTYVFNAGYGQLTIDNATTAGTTPSGELELGNGLTSSNIWFTQSGTDLDLQVLGSSDHVDVSGWFGTNASSALSEIVGGDGLKIDSGLSQLISAMATYETAHPTFNSATATTMPTDTTLQTAIAAAWHH